MSRIQNSLGRGLGDLIGEVSNVRAVPTRAPAPAAAPPPAAPPPPSAPLLEPRPRRSAGPLVWGLAAALLVALLACGLLAWRVLHPPAPEPPAVEPVAPEVVDVPAEPAPPPAPPAAPPRDTRLDWARSLAVPGAQVAADEARVRIVFDEAVFKSRDQLRPGVELSLKQVAAVFQPHAGPCVLVVVGHTDNDPARAGSPFGDNVGLGFRRAQVVADLLRASGAPAAALRVTSFGDRDPPYPNTDAAGKARNRTVTLLIERSAQGG